MTGYLQATPEQQSWLKDTYEKLRSYDVAYSKVHGWPVSIKLTTVKPSGTLSLLPGVTSGWHPAYAHYMVRRIRFASNSPIVDTCRDAGYPIEYVRRFDGTEDYSTVVVSFPFRYPENAVLASQVSAVEQLQIIERLQTEWSDNSVSATVYFQPEELDEIRPYLAKNYNKKIKTISFLRHSGHGFDQAPMEEITKEEYEALVAKTQLITRINDSIEFDPTLECAAGSCPIR